MARKTGLLLMNLGGPKDLGSVRPFLNNLFSDRDLIPLPFQRYAAQFISMRRTPKVQELYRAIGGGSPIHKWTTLQGQRLAETLNSERIRELDQSSKTMQGRIPREYKAYTAFRYTEPSTASAIEAMLADGVEDAVALTLYPQYSCSTTGSSLNELARQVRRIDSASQIRWSVVDRYAADARLASVVADHVVEALAAKYPTETERNDVVLLFSAHSLPMKVVNRGDPYPGEVAATVSQVMAVLPERVDAYNRAHPEAPITKRTWPHRIVWQSQVGPQAWLGPQLDSAIEGYARQGKNNLLVIPIAFVSDHIETLSEIDIEYGALARKNKVTGFHRVESLNDDPRFISALRDVVQDHVAQIDREGSGFLDQLKVRCPGCEYDSCVSTRELLC